MKRLITSALALVLTLSLSACGIIKPPESDTQPSRSTADNSVPVDENAAADTEVENKVELALDNTHYELDAQIAVTLDFGKLNQDAAVIAVVPSDTPHGETVSYDDEAAWAEYRWLSDFSELPFYLFPQNMKDGLYDVRVYADAESGKELASVTIAIGDAVSDNSGNTNNDSTDDNTAGNGDCTQKQMEDTIVSYLSKIGAVSSLTLGGGSKIEYCKAGDALNDFDIWTIYDPELDNNGMYEAMNSQLTAAGFSYEMDLVGRHVWYIDAGGERKGILFWPDDDEYPDGYYILMMTNKPGEY